MSISVIRTVAGGLLAFAMTGCSDDYQPNPHSMDLATQVVGSSPIASRAKIRIEDANKKRYLLAIIYPTAPLNGQSDGTDLTRAMIRKLLADGQQPHDQEISITVYGITIESGTVGESGRLGKDSERILFRATYYPLTDAIGYEDCDLDPLQSRHGPCP
jgi:hypothetical protein